MKGKHRWRYVGGAVALVVAALFFFTRSLPWQAITVRSEEAVFQGRAERLRDFFHPEELKAFGISEDDAIRAIDEVVAPEMDVFKVDRRSREFWDSDDQLVMKVSVYHVGSSESKGVMFGVMETDKGYRVLLSNLVAVARQRIIQSSQEEDRSDVQVKLSTMLGELTKRGISGYWHIDSNEIELWPEG